jgi:hypothetical protein
MNNSILKQYQNLRESLLSTQWKHENRTEIHDSHLKFLLADGLPLTEETEAQKSNILNLHNDFINENWIELQTLHEDSFANVVPFQIFESTTMTEDQRIAEWCKSLKKDKSYGLDMTNDKLNDLSFAKRYLNFKVFISEINFNSLASEISSISLLVKKLSERLNMIPNSIKIFVGECFILDDETIILQDLKLIKN